jgi:hypothetical protein
MDDAGWDALSPKMRTEVCRRGEEAMGGEFWRLSKDAVYAFAQRVVDKVSKMDDAAVEYEEMMEAKKSMEDL